jgi:hypothetical protein
VKKIFFDLYNGEIVEPISSLPKYMVIVHSGEIEELYTCFRVQNIADRGGQDWVDDQLHKEKQNWNDNASLRKDLRKFVRQNKFWFKQSNHFEKNPNRFIWIRFM